MRVQMSQRRPPRSSDGGILSEQIWVLEIHLSNAQLARAHNCVRRNLHMDSFAASIPCAQ
jgi:hypothetical protein